MKLLSIYTALFFLSACGQEYTQIDTDARVTESRVAIKEFAGLLKGELQTAMKSDGPVNAIEVCQLKAPSIASDISKKKGWQVTRTSLKTRNPANNPDFWERMVLKRFDEQKLQDIDAKQLEHYAVVEENDLAKFRYMKAIPTVGVCMNCHGVTLAPEVAQKIEKLYPNDQATGYKPGDIRGAFSITQTIR